MKGVQIFLHSVRQVTANLPAALRISGVLYLVQFGVAMLFGGAMMGMGMHGGMNGGMSGAGMGLGALVVFLVALVTAVWIAVAWHRFVLLAEGPSAPVPPLMQDRMIAYFLRSLVLVVIMIVAGAIIGSIFGILAGGLFMRGPGFIGFLLMALLVQLPLIFLGLRLAATLPGAALGKDHGILAGWEATKSDWQTILQLAAILAVAMAVLNLIGLFVFGGLGAGALLWQFVSGWLVMMVGLSILTTLYGHYIQKRPLV